MKIFGSVNKLINFIVLVVSSKMCNDTPAKTDMWCTILSGKPWKHQATELGLSVYQMAGFDPIKSTNDEALTIFAVGCGADDSSFLQEFLQERQKKQRARVRKDFSFLLLLPRLNSNKCDNK